MDPIWIFMVIQYNGTINNITHGSLQYGSNTKITNVSRWRETAGGLVAGGFGGGADGGGSSTWGPRCFANWKKKIGIQGAYW